MLIRWFDIILRVKRKTEFEEFCEDRKLLINPSKTQLIIFKSPNKRLSENFSLSIDGFSITPSPTVTLLGATLDQHFTMGPHIEAVVKKCHGLLKMLRRAGASLPRDLLKLLYVSMIRAQLEYCSATFVISFNPSEQTGRCPENRVANYNGLSITNTFRSSSGSTRARTSSLKS